MTWFRDIVGVEDLIDQKVDEALYLETAGDGGEEIRFILEDGREIRMFHMQDCCESVTLDYVDFDLDILNGQKILAASVDTEDIRDGDYGDTCTKTVYTFVTAKGTISFPWTGTSNGYYSESVDLFERMP